MASSVGPLILFLAAGFAVSSGLPTGDDLMLRAVRTLTGRSDLDRGRLANAFAEYLRVSERIVGDELSSQFHFAQHLTLERVLREEWALNHEISPTLVYFEEKHAEAILHLGRAVRRLADLCSERKDVVVVTVNFDELVEEALGESNVAVFASEDDFRAAPSYLDAYLANQETRTPLLKLHGTLSRPDTLVFRQEQTLAGLSSAHLATLAHLRDVPSEAARIPWVYIGSSMRDFDVLAEVSRREYAERFEERWVAPLPAPGIQDFAEKFRRDVWLREGRIDLPVRVVTEVADSFLATLASAVTAGAAR